MRNCDVDFDAVRYRSDGVSIDYELNYYVDQHRDLIFFCGGHVGEELPNSIIIYTKRKNNYPIQVIDLRFQVDYINKIKKIQLHQEYRVTTINARLFMILIRKRDFKMISDGNKINEVTAI